jgi:GNAT superfamily N-acetyltransferase
MPAWNVIVEDAGMVVAHVGIIDRVIKAGNRQLRIAGIQNVFVLPEYRGQGLSGSKYSMNQHSSVNIYLNAMFSALGEYLDPDRRASRRRSLRLW